MKKRFFLIFAAICLCVPVLGQLRSRYVWFGGRFYPRNTAVLALPRGLPEEELLRLAVIGYKYEQNADKSTIPNKV